MTGPKKKGHVRPPRCFAAPLGQRWADIPLRQLLTRATNTGERRADVGSRAAPMEQPVTGLNSSDHIDPVDQQDSSEWSKEMSFVVSTGFVM